MAARLLRGVLYFFLGVALSALFVGFAVALERIPAIVVFPNGSYDSQCAAHVASAIASHNCPNDAIASSLVDGVYPHKICRLTCQGQPWSDEGASASMGCQDPAVTPYEEGGSWWCAWDGNAACGMLAGTELPVGQHGSGYVSGSGAMNLCDGHCAVRPANAGRNNAANTWWASGPWYHTGAPCSENVVDTEPESTNPRGPEAECAAAGQGWGTVNGTVVCVPSDATEKTGVRSTDVEGKGKAVETTHTECQGDKCTTTKTRTVTDGGPSGSEPNGVTTTTLTGDGRGQGAGSGGGDGDGEQVSACDDPLSSDCLGGPPEGGEVAEEGAVVGGITAVAVSSGSCPAGVALGGYGVFDFEPFCALASMIRPAVLALAWLGAALFLVGALRNG